MHTTCLEHLLTAISRYFYFAVTLAVVFAVVFAVTFTIVLSCCSAHSYQSQLTALSIFSESMFVRLLTTELLRISSAF